MKPVSKDQVELVEMKNLMPKMKNLMGVVNGRSDRASETVGKPVRRGSRDPAPLMNR